MWKRFKGAWREFVDRRGFAVLITVCVAVITATAVWTKQESTAPEAPRQPLAAAQLQQESLRDAATAAPMPTVAGTPRIFLSPTYAWQVVRAFSATAMVKSGVTGVWQVHDAVDLACAEDSQVAAMADGVVVACGEDERRGAWLLIDHGGGIMAELSGLSGVVVKAGDRVRGGRMIGTSGKGPWDETDLPPHVHLRVTVDGAAVNPADLLN